MALVKNGDSIIIDAEKRQINLNIPAAELKKRKQAWKKPAPRYTRCVLAKYAAHVTSASLGAVSGPSQTAFVCLVLFLSE
jgi:dihydroxy-acid dehydratase